MFTVTLAAAAPGFSWIETVVFAAAMLVPMGAYLAMALWREKELGQLLAEPDAGVAVDTLIGHGVRPRSGLHPGVVVAQAAMLCALHGRYRDARTVLARYPWEGRPGSVLCALKIVEGLFALFERGNTVEARQIFEEAAKLADGTWPLFAMRSLRREPRAYVAIASLVEGRNAAEDLAAVEATFRRPPSVFVSAVAAWALAVDAYQRGDAETARRMIDHVQRIAPHCTPLHQLPSHVAVTA